jgi:hypothetical protein
MATKDPIFILGTTRSGTSALHVALMTSLKIRGFGEGHFFETISSLQNLIDIRFNSQAVDVPGNFLHNLDRNYIDEEIYLFYKSIYYKYFGGTFIDKTPSFGAITTSPLIHKVFPNAKIIYMQRRGIENIASKIRKFPNMSFEDCCNEWKECILAWRKAKTLVGNYIELEQFRVYNCEQIELLKIAEYLELTDSQRTEFFAKLERKDIQKTGNGKPQNIDNCGFTDEQVRIFRNICGNVMDEEGYSFNENYYV